MLRGVSHEPCFSPEPVAIPETREDLGGSPSRAEPVHQLTSSMSSKGAVNQIIG